MQMERWERIQYLFSAALEFSPEERQAYLASACDGDTDLLEDVNGLLAADAQADSLWTRLKPAAEPTRETLLQNEEEIGPYRVIAQIGAGGMGVVYRAHDGRLQRDVALKLLPRHLKIDENICQRFIAEARAASRLDHPNICVIYDIGETPGGQMYMAMPYYTGETLAQRIAHAPLSMQDALAIVIQVAEGLAAAHAKGIIHRDIKPANVMLTEAGGVKILDFGVAKIDGINLTSTGLSIGTIAYMAPEQLRGEKVDARADIWSLGATFYEMLTGQRVFAGDRMAEIMHAVLNPEMHTPGKLPAAIPAALHPIIGRALDPDLKTRYASADALLDDLRAVALDDSSAAAPPASDWDARRLTVLVELLTPQIGPIAPVLVQRMAKTASSLPALCNRLADHLPDEASRSDFLRKALPRSGPPATAVTGVVRSDTTVRHFDPQQLAQLEALLRPVLGPVTNALIRRQAASCHDLPALCRTLADYLPGEQDKALFLQRMKIK
jgi:eukaryotic-like serine/threonine-protein kinase